MKTAAPSSRGGPGQGVRARFSEARIAYAAGGAGAGATEDELDVDLGPVLRGREIETDYGPTVLLSGDGDEDDGSGPGSTMMLMSAGLLRKLLSSARGARPPRPSGRRSPRRRLDIKV